jgi:ATP-binding cassette, subfamily B, bacterial CvaB/MchF/RaxB
VSADAGEATAKSTRRRARAVPVVLQGEVTECGLACMAMIAGAWGLDADLATLRAGGLRTPRGINLRVLIDFASSIGLAARPVRIGLLRLRELKLPAVLHWNMDHFVVLERVAGDTLFIVDPTRGRVRIKADDASANFTGVAVEFTPTDSFQPGRIRLSRSFRRAWVDDRSLRSSALSVLWLTLLTQASIVSLPFAYQRMIDGGTVHDQRGLLLAAGVLMMIVVQVGSSWMRGVLVTRLGSIFVHRVTANIVARLFSLPIAFFHRQMLGDVVARVRSIDSIRRFVTEQAAPLIVDAAVAILTFVLMLSFSPTLATIVIGGIAIDVGIRVATRHKQRDLAEDLMDSEGKELSRLLESLRAMQAIKLAGREGQRFAVWENEMVHMLNANTNLTRRHNAIGAVSSAVVACEWAAILAVGVLGIGFAPVSLGVLFGFLAYRGIVRERLAGVLEASWSMQTVGVHLRRLDDLMLAVPEGPGGELCPEPGIGALAIEGASFRYGPTEPLVLDNVSLDVPAGACVALVGPSGSGKTSLIKLILGIESPTSGRILLDGIPMETIDRRAWRERFGAVMQDDTLLAGSIAENIAFFDAQIDMDEVRAAARAAAIDQEIDAMPMEYGSLVGDMGSQLSGGQRQRILIARALYRKAGIIVFDEGTANLDAESEKRVADVLATLSPTRLIIAHRSQLVDMADIVYELRHGRIRRLR